LIGTDLVGPTDGNTDGVEKEKMKCLSKRVDSHWRRKKSRWHGTVMENFKERLPDFPRGGKVTL